MTQVCCLILLQYVVVGRVICFAVGCTYSSFPDLLSIPIELLSGYILHVTFET